MSLSALIVVVFLLAILVSLGTALFHMLRRNGRPELTAKALTVRVALSLSLFILLFIGFASGLITPHGLLPQ